MAAQAMPGRLETPCKHTGTDKTLWRCLVQLRSRLAQGEKGQLGQLEFPSRSGKHPCPTLIPRHLRSPIFLCALCRAADERQSMARGNSRLRIRLLHRSQRESRYKLTPTE